MTTINPAYLPPSFLNPDGTLVASVTQEQAEQVSAGVQARVENMPPAQRDLFLAMLASSNIAPSADPTQIVAQANESIGRLENLSLALKDLATLAGSSFDFLMRVMIEQAGQQRKDALEQRLQAREAAQTELIAQAGKLEKSADEMMSGAIAALVIAVVTAVATAVLSGIAAARAGSSLDSAKLAAKYDSNTMSTLATQQGAIASGWSGASQAVGTLGGALGNTVNTIYQANSKRLEAEGSRDSAQAEEMKSLADIKKEMQQALDELIKAIVNFVKEMKDNEVQMMQPLTKL